MAWHISIPLLCQVLGSPAGCAGSLGGPSLQQGGGNVPNMSCAQVLPGWEQPLRANLPLGMVSGSKILQVFQEVPRTLGLKQLKDIQNPAQSFGCRWVTSPQSSLL